MKEFKFYIGQKINLGQYENVDFGAFGNTPEETVENLQNIFHAYSPTKAKIMAEKLKQNITATMSSLCNNCFKPIKECTCGKQEPLKEPKF